MKKKGLIISTIVMVVVLIASLTTATYAWFNSSAAATVQDVTVSVASASNISIGIATRATAARNDATSYVNGAIEYNETDTAADQGKGLGTFSSADSLDGLGLKVDWDWVLSSVGGVSSKQESSDAFDDTYNLSHALADGHQEGDNVVYDGLAHFNGNKSQNTTSEAIDANTVIYAPFGLRVEKTGLNYLYCDIDITPTSESFWGIVTALKLEITCSDGTTQQYHPFALSGTGKDGLTPTTAKTYQSKPTKTNNTIDKYTFRFVIAYNETQLTSGAASQIYRFDIRMFLDGKDGNCTEAGTPYGAKIGLKFDAVKTSDYNSLATANTTVTELQTHSAYGA